MSGKRKKDNGFSDDIRTVMPFRALLDHEWHMIPALLRNYSRTSSYDQLYWSGKTICLKNVHTKGARCRMVRPHKHMW